MMWRPACRSAGNPKLTNVFNRLSLIEAYGTGLKKILSAYQPMDANELFQATEKVFKVTLPRMNGDRPQIRHIPDAQNSAEKTVMEYISKTETITRPEVEQITGTSTASAARILSKMVQSGVLTRIGEGKNTRYRLAAAAQDGKQKAEC